MLELTPEGALSWSFHITENGSHRGVLELARFKSAGSLTYEGKRFELKRAGVWGPITLFDDGRVVAAAKRSGIVPPRFQVTATDRQVMVIGRGMLPRKAQIVHGDVVIGDIERKSVFRRTVLVRAHHNPPAHLLIFCTAIILLHWRKAARAAGS